MAELPGLEQKDIEVANIEPLKGLTALQNLNLMGTRVANIEPLKGLTALKIDWKPLVTLPKSSTH
jgi:Leucine-rich repeat (LRR) protein